MASSSIADANVDYTEFMLPPGKGETTVVSHIRNVQNPVEHGPKLKIRGELAKLSLTVNEITGLSVAMKQLCVYVKHASMQEQCRLVVGDLVEITSWVGYWLQSGVSPLILLPVVVYPNHKSSVALSNLNCCNDAIDGYARQEQGSGRRRYL